MALSGITVLKALCESRSMGSRVISQARYLGQEGEMGLLEGESPGWELLRGVTVMACFMLRSF